jgi:hypothetical protein
MREMESRLDQLNLNIGQLKSITMAQSSSHKINDYEFSVFSQSGEDGIIQFLIKNCKISRPVFVEFGVENYKEANTRFLLMNDNWSGLVIDSNRKYLEEIKKQNYYWRHTLLTENSFITKENINDLIRKNGISGPVGLLSIDIDGNDYWVWDAINVIDPDIVVIEYNSRLGLDKAVTIPYAAQFNRHKAHHSGIYYGASLKALEKLAHKKGYLFVGCNSIGQNAFFVKKDSVSGKVREVSLDQGFVRGQFRETRDEFGRLTFATPEEEQKILSALNFTEVN